MKNKKDKRFKKLKDSIFDLNIDLDFKLFLIALESDSRLGIPFEVFLLDNHIRYSEFQKLMKNDKKKRKRFNKVMKDVNFNLKSNGHKRLAEYISNPLNRNAELKKEALKINHGIEFDNDNYDLIINKKIKYNVNANNKKPEINDQKRLEMAFKEMEKENVN